MVDALWPILGWSTALVVAEAEPAAVSWGSTQVVCQGAEVVPATALVTTMASLTL